MKKSKKKSIFWRCYLIYTIALTLLVLVGLLTLWRFLGVYEASRPEHAMEEVLKELQDKEYASLSAQFVDEEDPYEKGEQVLNFLLGETKTEDISYGKVSGKYSEKHPVYAVTVKDEGLLAVTFTENEEMSFGLHNWKLESITPIGGTRQTVKVSIPEDMTLLANGIEVPGIEGETKGLSTGAKNKVYRLSGFFTEPSIEVKDVQGNVLTLEEDTPGNYSYCYSYLLVPQGMTAMVNGSPVDEKYLVGNELPDFMDFVSEQESHFKEYQDIANRVTLPSYKRYYLAYACPLNQVTICDEAGNEQELFYSKEDTTYYADFVSDDTELESNKQFAFNFIRDYSKFVANELSGSGLYSYFPSNSEYARKVAQAVNAYYPKHSNSQYTNFELVEYKGFSEDCAFVRVTMDQSMDIRWDTLVHRTYHVELPLYLVKVDGKWSIFKIDFENYKSEE